MTIFFNVVLLVLGTAATLAAFGGKTWEEGSKPILDRITPRGFMSLICLILALLLGTVKEFHARSEEMQKKKLSIAESAQEHAEAALRQSALSQQLATANSDADLASQKLENLRQIDKLTQERLDDTRASLDDMRNNLSATRQELSQQELSGIITSLTNANQTVSDIGLMLPLTSKGHQ